MTPDIPEDLARQFEALLTKAHVPFSHYARASGYTKAFPGFERLRKVLLAAEYQAAQGKGVKRHGQGRPRFVEQPLFDIIRAHGVGFATGQAVKKAGEARGLTRDAAVQELLGAIVYLAATIITLEDRK